MLWGIALVLLLGFAGCAGPPEPGEAPRHFISIPSETAGQWVTQPLESIKPLQYTTGTSSYFDRVMNYRESRFKMFPLTDLIEKVDPGGQWDALLLNCFDDYQGLITVADARRYQLHLATEIQLAKEHSPPGWLHPLLVIVPDGVDAPNVERFMTANIREVRWVRREAYYRPLDAVTDKNPGTAPGSKVFKDNCIFCHSVRGIGGNKGIRLLQTYDFSSKEDRSRFQKDFADFHGADNPDKQHIEQFVTQQKLDEIAGFLAVLQGK